MIGIFDSGSGGLTVLREVRVRMPSADIIYFGDTKHAPYGNKTREEITIRTIEAIGELARHGADSILSACNSVSASLAVSLFEALSLAPDRLIEMVGPTVGALKDSPNRLLIAATVATINSGIYQNAFRMVGKDVAMVAIPTLAGAIEEGRSVAEQRQAIREALGTVEPASYDTLVLSCTHYPLALALFEEAAPGKKIVNPADAVAERVVRAWGAREAGKGALSFILTADSAPFRARVAEFFPEAPHSIEVLQ